MLVLRRKEGQWIEVTHRSGDVLRFRVYDVSGESPGRVNLAFDDPPRHFSIQRPERRLIPCGIDRQDAKTPEMQEGENSYKKISLPHSLAIWRPGGRFSSSLPL